MEVTKIENVTRTYKIGQVETHALRGVSLSIQSGEFTAIKGVVTVDFLRFKTNTS